MIYAVTPRQNLRVGDSQTVSRPDFRDLARFSFLDRLGGLQTIGNSELVQTRISNYEARWEYFPGSNQLVAASFFHKNSEASAGFPDRRARRAQVWLVFRATRGLPLILGEHSKIGYPRLASSAS